MTKETKAYELGKAAFEAGLPAVPALDPAFSKHLAANPCPVGEGMPMLDAWIKGWHEANIAAPGV